VKHNWLLQRTASCNTRFLVLNQHAISNIVMNKTSVQEMKNARQLLWSRKQTFSDKDNFKNKDFDRCKEDGGKAPFIQSTAFI
jgi:hypothetical protein